MARSALIAFVGLAALAALPACSPPAPSDPSAVRADSPDDTDADAEPAEARAAAPASYDAQLIWLASEADAVSQAQAERRPVLMHFDSQWCADCKRMKLETFGDPRVRELAARFVAVRIDATDDEDPEVNAILQKYTVINVPTLILLDSKGHEQRRITELVGPDTFLQEINRVR
ncbi:MAG: thioredoxin family protein [Polyangiaceae bacterium]|nr:thioredoxin family protein [Polyangiaceae bacterium]